MGVLGLWQLLQPSSRPIKLQGLEGKKLAIDISIWLHQATKGVRNSNNGHILVLYNRICKLLYFKIKPVFVFDGPNVPKLKQRVLRDRQKKRNEAASKTKELDDRIKSNILESYALKNILGENGNLEIPELTTLIAANGDKLKKSNHPDDDIFKLENLPSDTNKEVIEIGGESSNESFEETSPIYDINKIDKETLESLPPEIQIEILSNYKDSLKSTRTASATLFPEESKDFSNFQMKALLHKSEISNKISGLKNEMKKSYSMTNFDDVYHRKIASSQSQNEVILFTRKSRTHLNMGANKVIELDDLDIEDDPIEYVSQKEPTMKIEFNFNNKIELVPTQENSNFVSKPEIEEVKHDKKVVLIENSPKNDDKPETISENTFDIFDVTPEDLAVQAQIMNDLKSDSKSKAKTENQKKIEITIPLDENIIQLQLLNEIRNRAKSDEVSIIESIDDESESEDDFVEITDVSSKPVTIEEKSLNTKKIDQEYSIQTVIPELLEPTSNKIDIENSQIEIDIETIQTIENYNDDLAEERKLLVKERQNTERLSNSIENYIIEDAKHLLQLFGLPYLDSPGEAEAQCAFLDYTGQTDGTITEDSDVWLFGAKIVYKSFFGQDPYIDSYSSEIIKSQLGFDRESLINVALLVGSDYTEGIESVGVVKTVEIFQEFEGNGIEKLQNFKKWHDEAKAIPGQKQPNKLRTHLAKLKIPTNFPSQLVVDAYLKPDIDTSTEEFTWSIPNLDLIRKYITTKLSWSQKKIDDDILPIIKRLNETSTQSSIENFFHYETTSSFNKQSKRMKNAICNLKRKNDLSQETSCSAKQPSTSSSLNDDLNLSDEDIEVPVKQPRKQPTKSSIKITKISKPGAKSKAKK